MKWSHAGIVLALAVISACLVASIASGGHSALKQRVAIEGNFQLSNGKGTFTLIPLTPGPLKRVSGTLVGTGKFKPAFIRTNGQRVTVIIGEDRHSTTLGTFRITQRVESVEAGRGWTADTGTWSFEAGTGVYEGVSGGGGFALANPQAKKVLYSRQEGYLTKR